MRTTLTQHLVQTAQITVSLYTLSTVPGECCRLRLHVADHPTEQHLFQFCAVRCYGCRSFAPWADDPDLGPIVRQFPLTSFV